MRDKCDRDVEKVILAIASKHQCTLHRHDQRRHRKVIYLIDPNGYAIISGRGANWAEANENLLENETLFGGDLAGD